MADPPAQQHPACCACKHQRRKCAPGCPLAPYFPAEKTVSFRNSHRLFGIKNILRFMTMAGPEKQDDCMKSIMYEADARAADPVNGLDAFRDRLRRDLARANAELEAVQEQLAKHRRAPAHLWMPPPHPLLYATPDEQHQQPFYGGYAPPCAVMKIDGDARIGANVDDEDAVMSMQHDDAEGRSTLAGANYGGEDVPSSSSYQSSDPSPRRLLNHQN